MATKSQLIKPKKCKICKADFTPRTPTQMVCSWGCASAYTQQLADKRKRQDEANKRKEYREAKEKQKTRSDWMREAQQAFNAWIRCRDKANQHGCISCGTRNGKENAGHFLSVGSTPELRFEPLNVHLQCERCNTYLSGNLINYRKRLIERIGLDKVEWLEGPHEPKHYSISDLKELKRIYKEKLKNCK